VTGKPGQRGRKPRTVPTRYRPGWLADVDKRYAPARIAGSQLYELRTALGSEENLSPQQLALTERATWLHIRLQQLEREYLAGNGLDAGEYVQLIGAQTSVLRLLGLHRVAKRVPRALEYAASVAAQESGAL
jgi:hypothetical protein